MVLPGFGRLYLQDIGNYRLLSVKLGYRTDEKVALKDVPDLKTGR